MWPFAASASANPDHRFVGDPLFNMPMKSSPPSALAKAESDLVSFAGDTSLAL
jgi:hypothetical protein